MRHWLEFYQSFNITKDKLKAIVGTTMAHEYQLFGGFPDFFPRID